VDPTTPSFDPSALIPYCAALGVEYHYLREPIVERAGAELSGDSLCAYCSRMKRGLLYACCRKHGFNKLVLAQHLDDLGESFLMSALHNGQLRTMKANYLATDSGKGGAPIRVIRPLVYVREHECKRFSYDARFPVINENCPACFEQPKERHRIKKLLAKEESLFPQLFQNFRRALLPLMSDELYTPLRDAVRFIDGQKQTRRKGQRSTRDGRAPGLNGASGRTAPPLADPLTDPNTALWRAVQDGWLAALDSGVMLRELERRGAAATAAGATAGAAAAAAAVGAAGAMAAAGGAAPSLPQRWEAALFGKDMLVREAAAAPALDGGGGGAALASVPVDSVFADDGGGGAAGGLVAVFFGARRCGGCRDFKPRLLVRALPSLARLLAFSLARSLACLLARSLAPLAAATAH